MDIRILQWNLRSIRSNGDYLKYLVSETKPHFVCLQETWLTSSLSFCIKGYHIHRLDRWDGYGGLALAVQSNIASQSVDLSDVPTLGNIQIQAVKTETLTIVNVYIPKDALFSPAFLSTVINKINGPFIVLGDFNAQNRAWGSTFCNSNGRALLDFILDNHLVYLNDGTATRLTPPSQGKSCVDITLASPSLALISEWSVASDPGNSDHFPVITSLKNNYAGENTSAYPVRKWKLSKADWFRYQTEITKSVQSHKDLTYDDLVNIINSAAEHSIPYKTNNQRQSPNPRKKCKVTPCWWDEECESLVRQRRQALLYYKSNFSTESFLEVKRISAAVKKRLREIKKSAFAAFCASLNRRSPVKMIWSKIKKFKTPTYQRIHSPIKIECLLKFLDSLTPPFAQPSHEGIQQQYFRQPNSKPFTREELQPILKDKKDSAPGMDYITYSMLAKLPEEGVGALLSIYNRCLNTSVIPEVWRKQMILPIIKPHKDANDYKSYRPIALQSCALKVLESLIKVRLEVILERSRMLPLLQFGFRRSRGCEDCINFLSLEIDNCFRKKLIPIVVFLDIKAAYDSVLIDILSREMSTFDVPRDLVLLIANIFKWKNVYVRPSSGNKLIGPQQSHIGIAQGSSLSPLLFNIYTVPLHRFSAANIQLIQYADDLALMCSGGDADLLGTQINHVLHALSAKLLQLGMTLSTDKCAALKFASRGRNQNAPTLRVGDTEIKWVSSYKYLGVIFEQNMSWKMHITQIVSKAQRGINVMKALTRTWWGADPKVLTSIYKSLVRSHLDFGTQALIRCSKSLLHKLDLTQYASLRVITGCMKSTPIPILLAETSEIPLSLRRECLATRYLTKTYALLGHPVYVAAFRNYCLFNEKPNKYFTPPLVEAVDYVLALAEGKVKRLSVQPCFKYDFNAQLMDIPFYKLNLSKSNEDNHFNFLSEMSDKFPSFKRIFTDASLSLDDETVGIGIFSSAPKVQISARLRAGLNICSAELIAIKEAIEKCMMIGPDKYAILSDSKSALQRLSRSGISTGSEYITLCIRELLFQARQQQFEFIFIWIPSHTNIKGNNEADALAFLGRQKFQSLEYRLPLIDVLPKITSIFWLKWIERYRILTREKGRLYGSMVPAPAKVPWYCTVKDLTREQVSTVCRMRSTHCLAPLHLNKIGIKEDSLCSCGEVGDINHLLFSCPSNIYNCNALYRKLQEARLQAPISYLSLVFNPQNSVLTILKEFLRRSRIKL